jgi:hypothetical protein
MARRWTQRLVARGAHPPQIKRINMITTVRIKVFIARSLVLFFCSCLGQRDIFAAAANSALLKAKQEAESKGYVLFTSHDEILSKAKNEPKLRVLASLEGAVKPTAEAFKKKYPFIDLQVETFRTVDESQRFLLQVKAGGREGLGHHKNDTDILQRMAAASFQSRPSGNGRAQST